MAGVTALQVLRDKGNIKLGQTGIKTGRNIRSCRRFGGSAITCFAFWSMDVNDEQEEVQQLLT